MALPKNHREHMRLHNIAIGNARRRETMKNIFKGSVNFPKGVMLEDIDLAFTEWVKKKLYITYDGEELPTFKLFSNQRISEYAQNWSHTDSLGNILMNFKAISRDNNPNKGKNQGEMFNIPGDRDYVIGYKPVLQENGQEAYDMYTMKQPYTLDLVYSITLITNKYELLNKMNQLVNYTFSALQEYLFPNGHAMPMKLDSISDESEYNLDDRKYYSQTYKINLLAYIVDPNGFKVTHLPSRISVTTKPIGKDNIKKATVQIEEDWSILDECPTEEKNRYENQKINVKIDFPQCIREVDFIIDTDAVLYTVSTQNIYDFVLYINDERQRFESDEVYIYNGDKFHIEISRDDDFKDSYITLLCYNPNIKYDTFDTSESELDSGNEQLNIEVK